MGKTSVVEAESFRKSQRKCGSEVSKNNAGLSALVVTWSLNDSASALGGGGNLRLGFYRVYELPRK